MQTFFPYPSYVESMKCLDNKRLGKQRVECKQILIALGVDVGPHRGNPLSGWRHHPAVRMWSNAELYLAEYALAACAEWLMRGFRDSLFPQFEAARRRVLGVGVVHKRPWWHGDQAFHSSHRSNLLRKDPVHYGQFGWTETPGMSYVWPAGRMVAA